MAFVMMKNSYVDIASLAELRKARCENAIAGDKALKMAAARARSLEQMFSPGALIGRFISAVEPVMRIWEMIKGS